MHISVFL